MGTTFVTVSRKAAEECTGFWMHDSCLELWLRLLALHLPDPSDSDPHTPALGIRNDWLLASRGYFTGAVPHSMEDACSSEQGLVDTRYAIHSLLKSLDQSDAPIDADTLNLMGFESGDFREPIERRVLRDVGYAFLDLLDGKITYTAKSTEVMPGTKPYTRVGG